MNAMTAILWRESTRLSGLLAVGLVMGLATLAAPSLGVWDRNLAAQFAVTTTFVAATVLAGGAALAGDLADRRLGFLFARPVPWWAIWTGTLGGAVVVSLAAVALAAVPGLARGDIALVDLEWFLRVFVPGLLISVGLAHSIATTLRSRDPWAALDVLLFGIAIAAIVLMQLAVAAAASVFPLSDFRSGTTALWVIALVLVAASAAQMAWGRSDIVRGRRAASLVLWPCVGLVLAVLALSTHRLLHPRPADLREVTRAHAAPAGGWISVSGARRDPPGFLNVAFDPASGRSVATNDLWGPSFSTDGRHLAWRIHGWPLRSPAIAVADLGAAGAPVVHEWPWPDDGGRMGPIALSDDGRTVLVCGDARAWLVDVAAGRILATVDLGSPSLGSPTFTGPATVRALRVESGGRWWMSGGAVRIVEIGAAGERRLGSYRSGGTPLVLWTKDAGRLLLSDLTPEGRRLAVLDGATGATVAEFPSPGGRSSVAMADWLPDGTVVVGLSHPTARLLVLAADGSVAREVPIAAGAERFALAAVGPDTVAITPSSEKRPRTLLVDVRSGRVVREEAGLTVENAMTVRWFEASHSVRPLFLAQGALVELDLATGARRRLLPVR